MSMSVALKELKSKYANFSSLALFSGAFICFFDLICDLVMVREFTMNKQYKSAQATIITLAISLGCQLIIVYGVNMKLRRRVIVRELLYVIFVCKARSVRQ